MSKKANSARVGDRKMAKGKYLDWITEEGLALLSGWARDGLTDEQMAHNIGISRSTLNEWKKKYPDISDTLKRGKEVVDRQVENALLKRALGYSYEEQTKELLVNSDFQRGRGGDHIVALTEPEWQRALAFFDHSCAYCGESGKMTKDHLIPLKKNGMLVKDNTIPCCVRCNSSKNDSHFEEWYQKQEFYEAGREARIGDYVKMIQLLMEEDAFENSRELTVTKVVVKQVHPDVTAQIFWLKNRKPDQWRDKQDINHSGGLDNKLDLSGFSVEELRKFAQTDG